MAQVAARIDSRGDAIGITFASVSKDGVTGDEKLLVSRIVKALAADPTLPTPTLRNAETKAQPTTQAQ